MLDGGMIVHEMLYLLVTAPLIFESSYFCHEILLTTLNLLERDLPFVKSEQADPEDQSLCSRKVVVTCCLLLILKFQTYGI